LSFKDRFCNTDTGTNFGEKFLLLFCTGATNHLCRNHAKHEKCNKALKHVNMASAARRQIIVGGTPIKKIGAGALKLTAAAARPTQGSTLVSRTCMHRTGISMYKFVSLNDER